MDSKQRFTRNEVMAIPRPDYTKTWHPVAHGDGYVMDLNQRGGEIWQ